MKVAIYIEDGITQMVLTPENEWEKSVIGRVGDGEQGIKITRGEFYHCRGGWVRHGASDESLILKIDIQVQPKPEVQFTQL